MSHRTPSTAAADAPDHGVQRRTIATLVGSQMLGGVGVASGVAVGSLLAEDVSGSAELAGLGGTFQVLGGALIAIPMARLMARRGRRPGLVMGYGLGIIGAALLIVAGVAAVKADERPGDDVGTLEVEPVPLPAPDRA